MSEHYSVQKTVRITPTMDRQLAAIPGNRQQLIRSWIRAGLQKYETPYTQNIN